MSEIKKVTINGIEFTFVNTFKSTRNGFTHTSEMFENSGKCTTGKASYVNRTWENYPFQTSMKNAVKLAICEREQSIVDKFKEDYRKTRVTAIEKSSRFEKDEVILRYKELLESL